MRWLDEAPDPGRLSEALKSWDELNPLTDYPNIAAHWLDRANFANLYTQNARARVARVQALVVQFPVFVFYECGRNSDGTYKWRGCRYGVEAHEYLSGFSD